MPSTAQLLETPRKELTVFYVLDTSGSMDGAKITTLNRAMEETVDAVKDLAKSNADARLKIAVLEYNTNCRWITSNGPEYLDEDFVYEYLTAGGLTEVGAALDELDRKLSRHEFLKSMAGALMPVIIFMSDGMATDEGRWEKALEGIRRNRWFKRATKIGFALGDDADTAMIASVVGNSEAVIRTNDLNAFRTLMKFVSVTSSMLCSTSVTSGQASSGADIVKQAAAQTDVSVLTADLNAGQYLPEQESGDDADDGFDGDVDEW